MELKLQPVMTRLHPREIAEAVELGGNIWKQSPLVRLFFRIGLYAIKTGLIPWDLRSIQSLLELETVTEGKELLKALPEIPAAEQAAGPGLAGAESRTAAVRRPRVLRYAASDPGTACGPSDQPHPERQRLLECRSWDRPAWLPTLAPLRNLADRVFGVTTQVGSPSVSPPFFAME